MEIEGLGHHKMSLPFSVAISDVAVAFFDGDGTIAGVAGIVACDQPGIGIVWMICTPALTRKPHTFVRQAKKWLKQQESNYRLLWNLVDMRNHFHHKLLKMLGFKALRVVQQAPNYLPYYEIVRLCASQQQVLPALPPPVQPLR